MPAPATCMQPQGDETQGLGVAWGNGRSGGPSPLTVSQVLGLVAGLLEVAPAWQAPEVGLQKCGGAGRACSCC